MAFGNIVEVVGNATRDPELRFTSSGQAVASFGIAVNRKWQNKQTNEWEEQVSFFDVTAWGTLGENIAESITKGTRVVVSGRLDQQSWEKEGQKHSKVVITADEVCPSLRWASCVIHKNERSENGGGNGGQSSNRGNSGGGRQQQQAAYDEEPFARRAPRTYDRTHNRTPKRTV